MAYCIRPRHGGLAAGGQGTDRRIEKSDDEVAFSKNDKKKKSINKTSAIQIMNRTLLIIQERING